MVGIIYYLDKEGKKKSVNFQGMKYNETPEEYLEKRGIEYKKVTSWHDES